MKPVIIFFGAILLIIGLYIGSGYVDCYKSLQDTGYDWEYSYGEGCMAIREDGRPYPAHLIKEEAEENGEDVDDQEDGDEQEDEEEED